MEPILLKMAPSIKGNSWEDICMDKVLVMFQVKRFNRVNSKTVKNITKGNSPVAKILGNLIKRAIIGAILD